MNNDKATDGLHTALGMLNDGILISVLIVGVYNDGRGYKMWSDGDNDVNDQVKTGLLEALPLKVPKLRKIEEDDGA